MTFHPTRSEPPHPSASEHNINQAISVFKALSPNERLVVYLRVDGAKVTPMVDGRTKLQIYLKTKPIEPITRRKGREPEDLSARKRKKKPTNRDMPPLEGA